MSRTTVMEMASESLRLHPLTTDGSTGLSPYFARFLKSSRTEQQYELNGFTWDREAHGQFVNQALRTVYTYLYGDRDSPSSPRADDELDSQMRQSKPVLEKELIDCWLPSRSDSKVPNQVAAAEYLSDLALNNPAVDHELYEWLAKSAPRAAFAAFAMDEVVRHEEIAIDLENIARGHNGLHRGWASRIVSDELRLSDLHYTRWLRQHLEQSGDWERIGGRSLRNRQWFAIITSNVFKMTLTRPGLGLTACGYFLTTETMRRAHWRKLLGGMSRLGSGRNGAAFDQSSRFGPESDNTETAVARLLLQGPALTLAEIEQVILGAQWSVHGAVEQYDRMMRHFSSQDAVIFL